MEIEDNSTCNKFFINGTPDLDKIIFINNINNGMGLTAGHSPISRFINLTNNYEEAENQETNASIGPSSPYCDCGPSMKNIQGNITVYKCNNIIQNNVEIYSLSCPKNHCKELHQNNYSIFIHNRKIGFDRKILESMVHLLLIGNTFKDCINHAKLFFNDKLPKLSTMHRVLKRYLVFTKLTGIYKKLKCNKCITIKRSDITKKPTDDEFTVQKSLHYLIDGKGSFKTHCNNNINKNRSINTMSYLIILMISQVTFAKLKIFLIFQMIKN